MKFKKVVFLSLILVTSFVTQAAWQPAAAAPNSVQAQNKRISQSQAGTLELLGRVQAGGSVKAVAIEGNYAYVGIGPRLVILDITQPLAPAFFGESDILSSTVEAITIIGTRAYVIAGGLYIFDISNPGLPVQSGFQPLGSAVALYVSGNYAYVAGGFQGLRIINVADPTVPVEVGTNSPLGYVTDVWVSGDYAYTLDQNAGLRVINISNPSLPIDVGLLNTMGLEESLVVSGNYAMVANMGDVMGVSGGLQIIDISNPASPTLTGSYPNIFGDVALCNDFLCIANGTGLYIMNISNPALPVPAGFYDTAGWALAVASAGQYAYVADNDALRIVNISPASNPNLVGSYSVAAGDSFESLTVANKHIYVANGSRGLMIFDCFNPMAPTLAGSFDTNSAALQVSVSGDYAYVADDEDGLRILDISHPTAPVEVGSYLTPSHAKGVAVSGQYVYVSDLLAGLYILDISNPASPELVGTFPTYSTGRITVEGHYVYLSHGEAGGLRIVDVATPSAPVEVGGIDTPGYAWDVDVAGNYAYIADGIYYSAPQPMLIVDISDPAHPTRAGSYDIPDATAIAAAGNYAYVIDELNGLYIVSTADPASPILGYDYGLPGIGRDLVVEGNFLYLISQAGLFVFWFGAPASAEISTSGGTLTSPTDSTSYSFSANTFPDTVELTHTARFAKHLPGMDGLMEIGHNFEIGAADPQTSQVAPVTLAKPYTISVHYAGAGPALENTLALYYWDGSHWVKDPTSVVDTSTNTIAATPNRLATWAVLGETLRLFLPVATK